jgi:hypothetical protein
VTRHLACLRWSIAAALVGVAAAAYSQTAADVSVAPVGSGDPLADLLVRVVSGGGLPAVLALLAWWARGPLAHGLPVTVQLHPDDRAELRRWRRELVQRQEPDSDDPTPPRAA